MELIGLIGWSTTGTLVIFYCILEKQYLIGLMYFMCWFVSMIKLIADFI